MTLPRKYKDYVERSEAARSCGISMPKTYCLAAVACSSEMNRWRKPLLLFGLIHVVYEISLDSNVVASDDG